MAATATTMDRKRMRNPPLYRSCPLLTQTVEFAYGRQLATPLARTEGRPLSVAPRWGRGQREGVPAEWNRELAGWCIQSVMRGAVLLAILLTATGCSMGSQAARPSATPASSGAASQVLLDGCGQTPVHRGPSPEWASVNAPQHLPY